MLYARGDGELYLHGSPLSRLVRGRRPGCRCASRSRSSTGSCSRARRFTTRSTTARRSCSATGRAIDDREEKHEALRRIVEHVARGRSDEVRGPSDGELKATEVIAMTISEASAKVRTGPPVDAAKDYALPIWAGELPLSLQAGDPVPDDRCTAPEPASVTHWSRSHA